MLRRAPIVMLSSTMDELASVRSVIARRVESSSTAEAWRFESNAVAAGSPPDEQYLGIARSCDLFVLIVASQQSDATEAEYQAAYEDNPEKVLPFYLDDGSPEVKDFRRLIDSRHARVISESATDLAEAIANAILDALRTGKLLRRDLVSHVDSLIDSYRNIIADVPILTIPHLESDQEPVPATKRLTLGKAVALSGVGGAGKSVTAAVCARAASRDMRTLPIVVPATQGRHDVEELVRNRFSSIRFDASSSELSSWAQEGRLLIVVDAIDGLSATHRLFLLDSAASWAERFPRCGIIVCGRRFSQQELQSFQHLSVARLHSQQLGDLLTALGLPIEPLKVPEQIRDIATTPLWATILMRYGAGVSHDLS